MFKRLMFLFCMLMMATAAYSDLSGSLDEDAIEKRIKPLGEVTVEGAPPPSATKDQAVIADIGQHRYEQTCKMCHETGLADAPKLGDKAAWQPRIAQGMETLLKHAIQGLKAMPPKGGCSTCSDEEIQKTVEYMVKKSK